MECFIVSGLNTVALDDSAGIVKRNYSQEIPREQLEAYEAGHLGAYDYRTIFYDVFLKADQKTIVAIGPPLLNFELEFPQIFVQVGARKLPFKYKFNSKKLAVFEAKLPKAIQGSCECEVHVGKFIYHHTLTQVIKPKKPTLICIQKDNDIQWIKDWIFYYKAAFAVENFVIYDNASTYSKPLRDELEGLAQVIDWPFPYGVFYKHANKYAQIGALNHFKLKFGGHCKVFNFDIDELLVCKDESFKKDIFSSAYMRFDSYVVNYDPNLPKEASFRDYVYREKQVHGSAYKYTFDSVLEGLMSVHYFDEKRSGLARLLSKKSVKIEAVDTEQAYFLHYKGISTNWKKHYSDKFKDDFLDKSHLLEDLSVQQVFDRDPVGNV